MFFRQNQNLVLHWILSVFIRRVKYKFAESVFLFICRFAVHTPHSPALTIIVTALCEDLRRDLAHNGLANFISLLLFHGPISGYEI